VLRALEKCALAAETFYYDAYRFDGNATDRNRSVNTFRAHSSRDRSNKHKQEKEKERVHC